MKIGKKVKEVIRRLRLIVFDFDGVFTDNMVYVFQDGREAVRCSRGDGMGLRKLKAAGIEALVLSMEKNPVVSARCKKLKITCIQGCENKAARLKELARKKKVDLTQVAFMGNDINDLECLKIVGLPIIVKDAHPDVRSAAVYTTGLPGGQGAVREVCDMIAAIKMNEH
jgi:YrbI family 3-deoxy-D-manno-octulosonate 8-phosphate phosphatase